MASRTYTTSVQEEAVLTFVGGQGGQTAAQYFDAFVKAALDQLRLTNQERQKDLARAEIQAAFDPGKSVVVSKDAGTGFPTTIRQ